MKLTRTLATVLAACIACTACAPREFPITLKVDDRFSLSEQRCIQAAVDEWRVSTDGVADVTLERAPVPTADMEGFLASSEEGWIYRVAAASQDEFELRRGIAEYEGKSLEDTHPGGFYSVGPDTIFVFETAVATSPIPPTTMLQLIVEHELGHLFGLEHVEEEGTLMYPTISEGAWLSGGVDAFTVLSFCDEVGCAAQ